MTVFKGVFVILDCLTDVVYLAVPVRENRRLIIVLPLQISFLSVNLNVRLIRDLTVSDLSVVHVPA